MSAAPASPVSVSPSRPYGAAAWCCQSRAECKARFAVAARRHGSARSGMVARGKLPPRWIPAGDLSSVSPLGAKEVGPWSRNGTASSARSGARWSWQGTASCCGSSTSTDSTTPQEQRVAAYVPGGRTGTVGRDTREVEADRGADFLKQMQSLARGQHLGFTVWSGDRFPALGAEHFPAHGKARPWPWSILVSPCLLTRPAPRLFLEY